MDAAQALWNSSSQAYNNETQKFDQQNYSDVMGRAENMFRQALTLAKQGAGPLDQSLVTDKLAMCLIYEKKYEEALSLFEKALILRKQANPVDTIEVAQCYDHIAMAKGFLQLQKETIIDDERNAYDIYSKFLPDDDQRLTQAVKMLAEYSASPAEAVPYRRQVVKIMMKNYGDRAPGLIGAEMFILAVALGNCGRLSEAIDQGNQAVEWSSKQPGNSSYANYIQSNIEHWKKQLTGAEPDWGVVYHNKFAGRNPRSKPEGPLPPTGALAGRMLGQRPHMANADHLPYVGQVPRVHLSHGHHHHHRSKYPGPSDDMSDAAQTSESPASPPQQSAQAPNQPVSPAGLSESSPTQATMPPSLVAPPMVHEQAPPSEPKAPTEIALAPPSISPLTPSIPARQPEPVRRPSDIQGGKGRRYYVAGHEVSRDKYDAAVLSNEACDLLNRHCYDEARAKLTAAVALDPGLASAHANLGVALSKLGLMDEAIAQIKCAVEQEPDKASPLSMLASTYQGAGQLDNALSAYRLYMQKFAGESDVSFVRALVDDLDKVATIQKEVLAKNPGAANASDYLAFITARAKVRWIKNGTPVKVFIASGKGVRNFTPGFEKALRDSFAEWVSGTGGVLPIKFVGCKDQADIDCFFTDNFGQVSSLAEGGETVMLYDTAGSFKHCSIALLTAHATDSLPPSENEIKAVCLHEIGHALGLTGHSPSAADIMYCSETDQEARHPKLTARDLATLKKLYG